MELITFYQDKVPIIGDYLPSNFPTASCSKPEDLSDFVLNHPHDPELDHAARKLDALLKREYEKLLLDLNLKRPRHPSVNTNITLPDLPNPPNPSSLEHFSASSNSNNQVELPVELDHDDDDADSDISGYEHCFNVMCCADEHDIYLNKFMRCTRCFIARYCDRKCHKEHWPLHPTVCGKVFLYSLKKQDLM